MQTKKELIQNLRILLEPYHTKIKDEINMSDVYINDFLNFIAIYSNYNFAGCPFYHSNEIKNKLSNELLLELSLIINKEITFHSDYTLFLQEMYLILLYHIFNCSVSSSLISIVYLNVKSSLTCISVEIENTKTINDLINVISEFCNMDARYILLQTNNKKLHRHKLIIEYQLDSTSNITFCFTQFG